nr:YjbH domain-containing protein [Citreimonas salinaria]
MSRLRSSAAGVVVLVAATGAATQAVPQTANDQRGFSFNTYGAPGLVDMPTAGMMPDAQLAATIAQFGESRRTTLSFQILPRLTGSFRYTSIDDFSNGEDTLYDRSFDLRFLMLKEGRVRPAIAVGLQDFIGTGIYSGEYLVASKTVADGLTVTGGVGWGRLGSYQSFASTGDRPSETLGEGGVPSADRWFRGDVAAFGGISYAPNDRLRFTVEYSSDDYEAETSRDVHEKNSPWNYGVDYRFANGTQLSLYHMYGAELGFQVSVQTNPKTLGVPGGVEAAPPPVEPRAPGAAQDLGWTTRPDATRRAVASLRNLTAEEGLVLEGIDLQPTRATVRFLNDRYGAPAQAIGRMARAMTRALPASVETFEIIPVVDGMGTASVIMQRSDLERLEQDAAEAMLARTEFVDAQGRVPPASPGFYPKFEYSLAPYLQLSVFDPDSPVRYDLGLRASSSYEITPGLILSGSLTQSLAGDIGEAEPSESKLPRVRTDGPLYAEEGDPAIEYLQAAWYERPGRNLYSRLTFGYLESMYAGASGEILWKPVESRFALGAELNYVQRRDYDQLFGLQDMETIDPVSGERFTIPDFNGHVSAYYDFGNGFHGQIDAGQYLAGDLGATVALDREFANGWSIGAYATFTDATADDFGEGSFDKGLRFSIPLATLAGTPSRQSNDIVIQSLSRDGGARLNVRGRLYDKVREYHEPDAAKSWGRFWR